MHRTPRRLIQRGRRRHPAQAGAIRLERLSRWPRGNSTAMEGLPGSLVARRVHAGKRAEGSPCRPSFPMLFRPSPPVSRLPSRFPLSMASQWQNFLQNLGEWRGSFATLDATGSLVSLSPSILTLESAEEGRLVRFGLRRWPAQVAVAPGGGPAGEAGDPARDIQQDYRSLGRQVVFFASGTFCKGSPQVAPGTAFGGEFGFICGDRRHRLVMLYGETGALDQLVLIREFRAGSGAVEQPATTFEQLRGGWQGEAATISADWPEPDVKPCEREVGDGEGLLLLPDGGFCRLPARISHRQAFTLEGGWLSAPGRLEILSRRYDGTGAWQSASHERLMVR
ncbi:MAG: DUF3598 family protein [Cyanobacteriota bacterium]